MPSFKVDTSTAVVFVAVPPALKVNKKTGEAITEPDNPRVQSMTIGLTVADEGEANLYTVTVPETGIPEGLTPGMPVAVTGLRARDWENEFNGQKRHGISFRAVAVTSLVPPAASNGKG